MAKKSPQFETLELSTEVYRQPFSFKLCHRWVPLGPDLKVHYYWMDGSDVRKGTEAVNSGLHNVSNCVQLWWRAVREQQRHGEFEVLQQLLLAEIYPTLARSKGQQNVFLDAFPKGTLRTPALGRFMPSEKKISPRKMAKPLHALLRSGPVSKQKQRFATAVIGRLLSIGTMNLLANPTRGLLDFRQEMESWVTRHRKKHTLPWMPWTLDLLAYSSKVAFYECYSNAWIAIVDELERQGLDQLSITFLRIWHFQDFNKSPNLAPPGPLGGIPISMHPISAYLMKIPQLRVVCGDFVKERVVVTDPKRLAKRRSYQVFCQAIEFAAEQYRAWHNIQSDITKQKKKPEVRRSRSTRTIARNSRPQNFDDAHVFDDDLHCSTLTDYLSRRRDRCACGGEIEVVELDSMRVRGETVTVTGRCLRCHKNAPYKINADELEGF